MESTPAIDAVVAAGVTHDVVRIDPPARSVEEAAAREGLPPERKIKTLVVRRAADDYLFVLVPGPRVLDWARLRDHLGVSRLSLPDADEARRVTGYARGTITPFGSLRALPVVADLLVDVPDIVSIGGGAHGVAIHLRGHTLLAALGAEVSGVTRSA